MKASVKPKPGFQVATLLAGVVLLMIVFVSAGYFFTIFDTAPQDTPNPRLAEVTEREAQWLQQRPARYRYTVDRDCYCEPAFREPYTVTVDGELRSLGYSSSFENPNMDPVLNPPEPVEVIDLFQLLYNVAEHADALSVSYHSEFGYPEIIRIDWRESQADDEQYFTIRDFRVLP